MESLGPLNCLCNDALCILKQLALRCNQKKTKTYSDCVGEGGDKQVFYLGFNLSFAKLFEYPRGTVAR